MTDYQKRYYLENKDKLTQYMKDWRKKNGKGTCKFCGKYKLFYTKNTCRKCYDEHIRGKKICKKCGNSRHIIAFGLCKYCYNKEKGYPLYEYIRKYMNGANNWHRFVAIKHHNIKCSFCNENRLIMLDVHHIDKNRKNNEPENLIFVCPNHHREIHRRLRRL